MRLGANGADLTRPVPGLRRAEYEEAEKLLKALNLKLF